jgi:hypothetical protein
MFVDKLTSFFLIQVEQIGARVGMKCARTIPPFRISTPTARLSDATATKKLTRVRR